MHPKKKKQQAVLSLLDFIVIFFLRLKKTQLNKTRSNWENV